MAIVVVLWDLLFEQTVEAKLHLCVKNGADVHLRQKAQQYSSHGLPITEKSKECSMCVHYN